ncbi:MAG: flagellar export protein FliJ [Cellulosilyticaceae bacterium]
MFKFKLESVLSLKNSLEDTKKRELGILNTQKSNLEQQQDNLIQEEKIATNTLKEAQKNHIDLQMIKNSREYTQVLTHKKTELQNQINEAEKKIQLKREELIAAMADRKILDNLKEIKKQEYAIELIKEQEKQVDEIVSYKYTKNGGEES